MTRKAWLASLLTQIGCSKGYQGPASDHFDGHRFHNLQATQQKGFWTVIKWYWTRPRPAPWQPTPMANTGPLLERVEDGRLHITYINHATLLIQHRGLNILTDPVWSERASPFNFVGPKRQHPPGLPLERLPQIDLILISHNHYDHLDLGTLSRLARAHPQAQVVTGLGNGPLIRQSEFKKVTELDWWQSIRLNEHLTLHAVPAQHWSARTRWDTNRTLWMGFVVESPEGPVLFPGDTGFGPEFELIHRHFGPMRFSALPIGAYEPRWFMRDHHMNPEDAVRAHRVLESQTSMAIHFGTFNLSDEGQHAPKQALNEAKQRQQVDNDAFLAPMPGEQWQLTPDNRISRSPHHAESDTPAHPMTTNGSD